jgi:hypothetical protein
MDSAQGPDLLVLGRPAFDASLRWGLAEWDRRRQLQDDIRATERAEFDPSWRPCGGGCRHHRAPVALRPRTTATRPRCTGRMPRKPENRCLVSTNSFADAHPSIVPKPRRTMWSGSPSTRTVRCSPSRPSGRRSTMIAARSRSRCLTASGLWFSHHIAERGGEPIHPEPRQ